jgi:hypothetical protein
MCASSQFNSRVICSLAMSHFFSATEDTGDTEKKRVFSVPSVANLVLPK